LPKKSFAKFHTPRNPCLVTFKNRYAIVSQSDLDIVDKLIINFIEFLELSNASLKNEVSFFQHKLLLLRCSKIFEDFNHISKMAFKSLHHIFECERNQYLLFSFFTSFRINNISLNDFEILYSTCRLDNSL